MTLLERIKELCIEKGINPSKLEIELGFGRATLYKWEKSSPTADKIEKVANYFNVSVDYLLGRTAFRTPMELFEHWGYSPDGFEAAFDFGELLKTKREKQGISQEEVSSALNITVSDVENIEEGLLPLNYDWAEKYATFLGTSVTEIFIDNGMGASLDDIPLDLLHHYQEQGMSEKEMVETYDILKSEEEKEALKEDLKKIRKENTDTEIHTIAAHHDGIDWTEEELEDIENFKKYVLSKRKNRK